MPFINIDEVILFNTVVDIQHCILRRKISYRFLSYWAWRYQYFWCHDIIMIAKRSFANYRKQIEGLALQSFVGKRALIGK